MATAGSSFPPAPAASRRALLFRIGPVDAALPLAEVREVLPCPELRTGPGQPPFAAGFFDLDGAVALVLRLDRLLGLPDSPEDLYAPLVRLTGSGAVRLLLVDRVEGVVDAPDVPPADPAESFNGCVAARFERDGRVIHLLDRTRLLLAGEETAARAFAETEAARLAALRPETPA